MEKRVTAEAEDPKEFVLYCEPCQCVRPAQITTTINAEEPPKDLDGVEGVVSCTICKSIAGNLTQLRHRQSRAAKK
jgi:hypothetical protein